MRLLLLDVAVGGLLLATIAIAAGKRVRRVPAPKVRTCAWLLVAVPLPAAVVIQLAGLLSPGLNQALFLFGAAAFGVGAFLILAENDEGWREAAEDDTPPWWPAFERELQHWEREQERRRRLVRT
jgi:hypothetical protein